MPNLATPLPVDSYARFMSEMFDERNVIHNTTAWQAFFGVSSNGGRTVFSDASNVVDIDIVRGNEKVAKLIQRGTDANPLTVQENTQTQNYTSFSRKLPITEQLGSITASQLNNRLAGENPYSDVTRMDRLRGLALDHHMEHVRRIVRLNEILAGTSILFGKQPALGNQLGDTPPDQIYDFKRNTANTITSAIAWDQVGATILADIDAGCLQARIAGKTNPDMIIFGQSAFGEFLKNDDVKANADNRRFELIEVSTNNPVPDQFARFTVGGFQARGRLRTPDGYTLWMFTYIDGYTDDQGVFQKYMPNDFALIASSLARCDRYFGPADAMPVSSAEAAQYQEYFGFNPSVAPMPADIANMDHAVNAAMFHFDAFLSANRKGITLRTQSAPIFAPTQVDSFVLLDGLITP